MSDELLITSIPGRTGLYLTFREGTRVTTVARFSRGEESARQFVAWAKRTGIRCEGDMAQEG